MYAGMYRHAEMHVTTLVPSMWLAPTANMYAKSASFGCILPITTKGGREEGRRTQMESLQHSNKQQARL